MFTQLAVPLQSYTDEFNMPKDLEPTTPAEEGQILVPCELIDGVNKVEQSKFCT
jgi:hypothetical protein